MSWSHQIISIGRFNWLITWIDVNDDSKLKLVIVECKARRWRRGKFRIPWNCYLDVFLLSVYLYVWCWLVHILDIAHATSIYSLSSVTVWIDLSARSLCCSSVLLIFASGFSNKPNSCGLWAFARIRQFCAAHNQQSTVGDEYIHSTDSMTTSSSRWTTSTFATLPSIHTFDAQFCTWKSCRERLNFYFKANRIQSDDDKKSLFPCPVKTVIYNLLESLVSP